MALRANCCAIQEEGEAYMVAGPAGCRPRAAPRHLSGGAKSFGGGGGGSAGAIPVGRCGKSSGSPADRLIPQALGQRGRSPAQQLLEPEGPVMSLLQRCRRAIAASHGL